MDALYVVFFIIIIVILLTGNSRLSGRIDTLERLIVDLHKAIANLKQSQQVKEAPKAAPVEPEKPRPEAIPPMPKVEPVPDIKRTHTPEPPKPTVVEHFDEIIQDPTPVRKPPIIPPPQRRPMEPQPSFFEQHPDLEKFIGENLVNKIGIAILVLAIGFFVKYAIDNNWVGPAGRVGIGILCGGILVGIAHRLRKSYKAFSSVLVGGGIAVFYFTITLAFHQFHLFDQMVSFIMLIVITAFAVTLSLLYDRQELAIIALVGGMTSPFMVSTGQANYNALFIYLIVLNVGLLVIAYFKSWRILNILAFGLTVIVISGIIYTLPDASAGKVFLYISILYLVFFLTNIANNIKENKAFIASDFTILLANTALYFSSGLYLLHVMQDDQYRGLFCASIGGLNLLFSFVLFKTKKAEINILYLLIGITLTFLSLTAPIQLHGHFITLFWAAESVLIFWLYTKSNIKVMQWASIIVWVAMICSLLLDWFNLYTEPGWYDKPTVLLVPVIANKGFITTIFSALCSFLLYILVEKTDNDKRILSPAICKYLAFVMLFCAGALEINHQFLSRYPDTDLNYLYLLLYLPAFMLLFLDGLGRIKLFKLDIAAEVTLYSLTVLAYLMATQKFFDVQNAILITGKVAGVHFMAHWLGDVLMLIVFYRLISLCKSMEEFIKPVSWLLSAALVAFLSMEMCLLTNALFYIPGRDMMHIETVYIKTGLPVLWGITSFALMWLGMRYKTRVLRIISLTLFSLTLVKLFAFDIENIAPAGKIAAFFCLGILLLIISFMYQKVKVIIKDDDTKPEN